MEEYITVSFRMLKADHEALKQVALDNQRDVTKQLNFLIKKELKQREASR